MSMRINNDYVVFIGDVDAGGHILWYGYLFPSGKGYTARAGGGLANATILTTTYSFITTCANPADSVKLYAAPVFASGACGPFYWVRNNTANACDIFPGNAAHQIDALGAGNAYSLAAGASVSFIPSSTSQWWSF